MSEVTCEVCGRKIDSRGLSGHMKTHKAKPDKVLYGHEGADNDGVISYPSNEQKIEETGTVVDLDESQGKRVKKPAKKPVKKTVASKPASSPPSKPASSPDPRGQRKTEKEWQGLFRD